MKKKQDLDQQILDKKKYEELERLKEEESEKQTCNGTVPSTQFIKNTFGDPAKTFYKLNKIENEFDQKNMLGVNQRKARVAPYSAFKGTYKVTENVKESPGYISEKDRFNVRGNNLIDFVLEEKENKKRIQTARIESKRRNWERVDQNNYLQSYLKEEQNKFSQYQRSNCAYNYDHQMFLYNQFLD